MRPVGFLLFFLFTVLNGRSQGDVVFDNFGTGPIFNSTCPIPASLGIQVQLYASMTANGTFIGVPGSIVPMGIPADGYFDAGVVRIPASIIGPGAAAFMEVRAWEAAYGATYEEAVAAPDMNGRPALRGISSRFAVNATGNPNASPPGTPVPLSDLVPGFSFSLSGETKWNAEPAARPNEEERDDIRVANTYRAEGPGYDPY
jgi:hypothetical protein